MFLHLSVILFTGGVSGHTPQGRHSILDRHPGADTPLGKHPPWADTPVPSACWEMHFPSPVHAGIHTPHPVHAGIHPPHSACWDTVINRAVRILLECLLVIQIFAEKNSQIITWCHRLRKPGSAVIELNSYAF